MSEASTQKGQEHLKNHVHRESIHGADSSSVKPEPVQSSGGTGTGTVYPKPSRHVHRESIAQTKGSVVTNFHEDEVNTKKKGKIVRQSIFPEFVTNAVKSVRASLGGLVEVDEDEEEMGGEEEATEMVNVSNVSDGDGSILGAYDIVGGEQNLSDFPSSLNNSNSTGMNTSMDSTTSLTAEDIQRNAEEYFATLFFIAIGVGYLFPFSCLTQPVDYWATVFPDFDIEFDITAIYMWTNLVVLALVVFFGNPNPNYSFRIYAGFAGQFLVLLIIPTSYLLSLDEGWNVWIVLSCTAVAAAVTALIDSCVISLASLYPLHCQEALQAGIGISTLIGSVYRLISKGVLPDSAVILASLIYFYFGAITILLCGYGYASLIQLDLSKERLPLSQIIMFSDGAEYLSTEGTHILPDGRKREISYEALRATSPDDSEDGVVRPQETPTNRWEVFYKASFNEAVVFVVFTNTLVLWPSLVAEIPCYNIPSLRDGDWWPLILLFVFAFSDVCGRFCVPYRLGLTKDNIYIPVLFRFILSVPLIVLLVQGTVPFFRNDIVSFIVVTAFGYTNGYLGSLSIVLTNEAVDYEDRGSVGTLTGFTLNAGLAVGSSLAVYIEKWFIG